MIKINNKNLKYNLIAVANNEANSNIDVKAGKVNFITENNTFYLIIKNKGCLK